MKPRSFLRNGLVLSATAALLAWLPGCASRTTQSVANAAPADNAKSAVKLTQNADHIAIEVRGEPFTKYWFTLTNHPSQEKAKNGTVGTFPARHTYFWPLLGPGGTPMTRDYPMNSATPDEEHDHKHHRSLWFAHGSVNGTDFWAEELKDGRIEHVEFTEVKSGADFGLIREKCKWTTAEGKTVCTDDRVMRIYNRPGSERMIDFEVTIHAPAGEAVVFGDTKEGSMAIRVNEAMRVTRGKNTPGTGHIVLSTGIRDKETWGKAADWCDYNGPINGKVVGVAMFDHPKNPVHPTWWHVRDYGLFAANPFGVHDFEKKPANTGNLTIPAGKSVTFRYRIYIHEGDEKAAQVAERYSDYVSGK